MHPRNSDATPMPQHISTRPVQPVAVMYRYRLQPAGNGATHVKVVLVGGLLVPLAVQQSAQVEQRVRVGRHQAQHLDVPVGDGDVRTVSC